MSVSASIFFIIRESTISRILDGYPSLGLIVIQFPASLLLFVIKWQRATETQHLGNVKTKLSQETGTCVQTGTHNVADGKKKKKKTLLRL